MGQVILLTYRPQLPLSPRSLCESKGMLCIPSRICAQFRYALAGAMLDQFLYRDAMHHRGKIVELAARAVGAGMQPMAAVIYDMRIRLDTCL